MQALPARPVARIEVPTGKGVLEEIAAEGRTGPFQFDTVHQFKVPGLARVLIQQCQAMCERLVFLGIIRMVVRDGVDSPKIAGACKVCGATAGA